MDIYPCHGDESLAHDWRLGSYFASALQIIRFRTPEEKGVDTLTRRLEKYD